jgi:hypothetical protein
MHHQDQVAVAHKLLLYLHRRSTALAESLYLNPVSEYAVVAQDHEALKSALAQS